MHFGRQFDAQSLHDRERGLERRIAVRAKRAVELFAGKPGLAGNLGHALGASDHAQRMGDVAGIP